MRNAVRVVEKIKLVETIAVELQSRYTFDDIDVFLGEFPVSDVDELHQYNSKRIYVKDRLRGVPNDVVRQIAQELDIDIENATDDPPKNWSETSSVKAFISHTAKDKAIAKRLRDVFKSHNVDCFVAHEDIKPSEEWQEEIRKALNTMDFFISIHTEGFSERIWCQQEVGFAVARGVKVIPIKFGEDPEGFIGKYQALIRGEKKAEDVASDILSILENDPKTADLYKEKIATSDLDDEIPF